MACATWLSLVDLGPDPRRPRGAGDRRRPQRAHRALDRARRRARRLPRHAPALHRLRCRHQRDAVRRDDALDPALQRQLPPRRRRHLGAVHPAEQLHDRAGRDRGLGGDPDARRAVHGGVPDHVGAHQRRVRGARRRPVLRVLRGDADPDVPHHRRLGRPEPRLRGDQVLPLHAARLAADAGRASSTCTTSPRQLRDPRLVRAAALASARRSCCSSRSSWRSR